MAVEAQTSPSPPFSTEILGPCEQLCGYGQRQNWVFSWVLWCTCGNDEVHCVGSRLATAIDGDGDVIKNKIKCFLELFSKVIYCRYLVQFWGLVKTGDKMYLTTRHQPFALLYYYGDLPDVNKLFEYRKHCLKYSIRTVDDDDIDDDEISVDGVQQLIGGPLSRAFRSGLPEYAPDVRDYTSREYPLRDYAVGHGEYLALPIYHHPTHHLPSGVLEFANLSPFSYYVSYRQKEIVAMLQEVNLTIPCFSLAEVSLCQAREIDNIGEVLRKVCTKHKLPYAKNWTTSGEILMSHGAYNFIRKGQGVVGKAFSSKSVCFCSDTRQLSIAEYPMVPRARRCKYPASIASFAVCLQSSCSNCIYVLEFFLPTNEKDYGDPRTLLHMLMETLKEHLRSSYKIASGQELGQKLSVEVLKVSPEDELDSLEICNTTSSECTPRLATAQGGEGMTQVDPANAYISGVHGQQSGIVGSPPRPEHVQGFNASNLARVDAANNSMNGIYEQQNGTVGSCLPWQELVQNDEPSMEIDVANPERDGVSIEQSANEVINMKKQKSSYTLQSDLGITREVLEQNSSRNLEDAAKALGVSRSTLKRICRKCGIHRWPPRKVRKINQAFAEQRVVQPSIETIEEHHRLDATWLEDDSCVWVKAKYQGYTMKFRLPLSARKSNLEEEVAQRLKSSIGSFKIEYQDEENDWIWIACDKDLSTCMNTLSSLGRTTIKMKVK